jgi:hypothetical protein
VVLDWNVTPERGRNALVSGCDHDGSAIESTGRASNVANAAVQTM